jgi:hypothetical protein
LFDFVITVINLGFIYPKPYQPILSSSKKNKEPPNTTLVQMRLLESEEGKHMTFPYLPSPFDVIPPSFIYIARKHYYYKKDLWS